MSCGAMNGNIADIGLGSFPNSKALNSGWPEFIKEIRTKKSGFGATGHVYLSNKKYLDRRQWKMQTYFQFHVSDMAGWWHQFYATVSPLKWVSLGILNQTHSVKFGGLIHLNSPGGLRLFFALDGKRQCIGLSFLVLKSILILLHFP